jgi:hypothetical protein
MKVKIKMWITTGYHNASHEKELEMELPDDATEDEIEGAKQEALGCFLESRIEWGWIDIED